jgi:hypothetical protein
MDKSIRKTGATTAGDFKPVNRILLGEADGRNHQAKK